MRVKNAKVESSLKKRDLMIDVYGKRLTSDTSFALNLTLKCFSYTIYSEKNDLRQFV